MVTRKLYHTFQDAYNAKPFVVSVIPPGEVMRHYGFDTQTEAEAFHGECERADAEFVELYPPPFVDEYFDDGVNELEFMYS